MPSNNYTQEQITQGLMAVVAWAGNHAAAHRYLAQKGLHIPAATLTLWSRDTYFNEYEQLREHNADQMEKRLAHEYRDVAAQAVETQKLAVDKAYRRLTSGDDHDPAKTAMLLSRVSHSAVEKLMTLTNRPEKILDKRSPEEAVRSLVQMGVLKPLPAGTPEAVDADAEDEVKDETDPD